jgi:ubiquinone/menaquinone biosynthesis C-methylase UbiE
MSNPAGTPSSRVDFSRFAKDYEVTRGIPDEFMKEIIQDIIHTCELKPGNRVLELGCGGGRFLRALTNHKLSVVGIDVSQGMLEQACANQQSTKFLRSNLVFGDAAAIPLNQGIFKAIMAIHLFHLMTDWQDALKETSHVLGTEGTIITGYVESMTSQSYLSQLYRQRRDELGYPTTCFGAHPQEVITYLKTRGANIETHTYETQVEVPLHVTLSYFERRVFSSMWRNLPDVIHRQIMQDIRAAASTQFKDINDIETVKIDAQLHFLTF